MRRLSPAIAKLISILCCLIVVVGCNETPTDIAKDIVPGSDSIYALSSNTSAIMPEVKTVKFSEPLVNNSFMLFGKTADSEARILLEWLDYPKLGSAADYEVLQSDLVWLPQLYFYGDTTNTTLSVSAFELNKVWSASATWDSIWNADGTSEYYSTAQTKVASFTKDVASTDSILYIPFNVDLTKKWLINGADSTTAKMNYGIALQAEVASSIRQVRYLQNAIPTMRLRVVTKHKDSAVADTNYMNPFAADFVNAPAVDPTYLVVQGALKNRVAFQIALDSLPPFSILLGASFTVKADVANSQTGTYGVDELLALSFNTSDSTRISIITRRNENHEFVFSNIATLLQNIRTQGGKGTLYLSADGSNEVWRMNRLRFFGADAEAPYRPKLVVTYAIPKVFQ